MNNLFRVLLGKPSGRFYSRLVLVTAGLTFALIVLGGVVRVTGSGFGCPDWPLCYGGLIPPFNPATLLEYAHRLVAFLVSTLVVVTALAAWRSWRNDRPVVLIASLAAALLGVQVVLGGLTVIYEFPSLVESAHLFVAEILLGLLVLLYCVLGRRKLVLRRDLSLRGPGSGMLWLTAAGTLAASFLLLSGVYVRTGGATDACLLWPLCGPELLPAGGLPNIHMAHRLVSLTSGALVLAALWATWQRRKAIPAGSPLSLLTALFFVVQVATGAFIVFSDFTPLARGVHLVVATGVWTGVVALAALTWLVHFSVFWRPSPPADREKRDVTAERRPVASLSAFLALTKPGIVGMLLVTALGGAFLAAGGPPPFWVTLVVLVGGALTSGGANAVNNYLDRDIDGLMERTHARPIPSHRISPASALALGLALNLAGFLILAAGANILSAVLALVSSGFYLLVYTGWLKRSTSQNIVIGGAAGAMPPVVAWAAITNSLDLPVLYLFLIIFFWTPPHFWALALLVKDDYARLRIPMLPVVRSERYTFLAIAVYVLLLAITTVMFFGVGKLSGLYLLTAIILNMLFIYLTARSLFSGGRSWTARLYKYSIVYIALMFLAIIVDTSMRF